MGTLHVKAATHNVSSTTVGTKDDDTDPYGLEGAFDNVAAGDEIRIWADAVYSVAAQVAIDTTAGTEALPIVVTGANASGDVDETRPVLQASATINGVFYNGGSNISYYNFLYLDLDGNSNATNCVNQHGASTSTAWSWFDCKFHDATGDGYELRGSGHTFVKCEAYDNGGDGWGNYGGNNGWRWVACISRDNTGHGWTFANSTHFLYGCLGYGNGGDGVLVASTFNMTIIGCVFYNNTGDGVELPGELYSALIVNNSFVSNGAYGLNGDSSVPQGNIDFNHYHDNGTAHCSEVTDANINDGTVGTHNQTGDPLFIDPTGTPSNFTPERGSILIGRGVTA